MTSIDMTTFLTKVGLVLGLLVYIPQLVLTLRSQSADDVSEITYWTTAALGACFLPRMIVLGEITMSVYYGLVVAFSLTQVFLIRLYRKRGPFNF
ncbi:MAG: hypothetical protein KatS3mg082_1410 [Nitrospiraceae bacterium]|nr:MAG: hypothetical protein KatS3mg082_1410 [Nitrospiraceae bacterium]